MQCQSANLRDIVVLNSAAIELVQQNWTSLYSRVEDSREWSDGVGQSGSMGWALGTGIRC